MSLAKSIYHRFIPESFRNPVGLFRRRLADRIHRMTSPISLPPASLLENVQMTPFVGEFIEIGRRSSRSIQTALEPLMRNGLRPSVLDFGCGCGRTALNFRGNWLVHGCDVDHNAVKWLQDNVDMERFRVNGTKPPLPWDSEQFDAIYAVSVFTHFSELEHQVWRRELARISRPGGLLAVSSMGPGILSNFPVHATEEHRKRLASDGFFFVPDSSSFNANAAFHTPRKLAGMLAPEFELVAWSEQGLDGFQDLTVLRKA